jgi:hypothetical protein
MNDDTLREECEAFLNTIEGNGTLYFDTHEQRQYFIDDLVAFACAQQAKVWSDAARTVCNYNCDHNHGKKATKACDDLETMFIEKAQATAREGDDATFRRL